MTQGFHRRSLIAGAWILALVSSVLPGICHGITISSELIQDNPQVTDTVRLEIFARWTGEEAAYRFQTPQLPEYPALRLVGQQTGGGSRPVEGEFVSEKMWRFRFVCEVPGTTSVLPPTIVYTNTESSVTDSATSATMQLVVAPAPPSPFDYTRLIPYGLGVIVLGALAFAVAVLVKRQQNRKKSAVLHVTPEEEAARLLEDLRAIKREDQCEEFYTSLETIALGLWEAKTSQRLSGKTPEEVAAILKEHHVEPEVIEDVRQVLKDCQTVRFSRGRVPIQAMDVSYQIVASWMKPDQNG